MRTLEMILPFLPLKYHTIILTLIILVLLFHCSFKNQVNIALSHRHSINLAFVIFFKSTEKYILFPMALLWLIHLSFLSSLIVILNFICLYLLINLYYWESSIIAFTICNFIIIFYFWTLWISSIFLYLF